MKTRVMSFLLLYSMLLFPVLTGCQSQGKPDSLNQGDSGIFTVSDDEGIIAVQFPEEILFNNSLYKIDFGDKWKEGLETDELLAYIINFSDYQTLNEIDQNIKYIVIENNDVLNISDEYNRIPVYSVKGYEADRYICVWYNKIYVNDSYGVK